ncbi:MAG: HAD family hydrolase [Oscillospiraceae bacterium]|nr:HAD family hydrolase [Oscillospiraceae bacterium]
MFNKKGILFDLDGTLWNSSEGVARSFNIALEQLGYDLKLTANDLQSVMGKVMDEIAHIFFDCIDPDKAEDIMRYCTKIEGEYIAKFGGPLYAGLEETLKQLKQEGWFIACVSNCQSGYIEAFLQFSGLGEYFDDIECWGNTLKLKAYNIALTAKRNKLTHVVYVGDTLGDYNSANEAGVKFVHASYGFGEVPAGTPKIASLSELPDLAAKLIM